MAQTKRQTKCQKTRLAQKSLDLQGGTTGKRNIADLIAAETPQSTKPHRGGYFIGGLLAFGIITLSGMTIWPEQSGAGTSSMRPYYASSPSGVEIPTSQMPISPYANREERRVQNRPIQNQRQTGSLGGDVILPSDILNPTPPEDIAITTPIIETVPPETIIEAIIEPEIVPPIETVIYAPPSNLTRQNNQAPPSAAATAAWQENALAFTPRAGRPLIAIVIDDLGNDHSSTRRTIALPSPITLSFLPNVGPIQHLANEGRAAGHELMVHMPMEPMSTTQNPGHNALRTSQTIVQNLEYLELALNSFEGHVGFNNHMGSRFTSDMRQMSEVIDYTKNNGYMYMDSRTIGSSVGNELATAANMPHAARDIFLDHEINETFIRAQLRQLERTAQRQGYAVAIGHPHDVTLRILAEYLPTLAARGYDLAPITAIAKLHQNEDIQNHLLQASAQ